MRTNAAWALSSCNNYGKYTVMLWKSIVLAFENAQHVPSYVEYPHRDALIQQVRTLPYTIILEIVDINRISLFLSLKLLLFNKLNIFFSCALLSVA